MRSWPFLLGIQLANGFSTGFVSRTKASKLPEYKKTIVKSGHHHAHMNRLRQLSSSALEDVVAQAPQVYASGYSMHSDLKEALKEAVEMAASALPSGTKSVDVALVFVSSLYDGGAHSPSAVVVPSVTQTFQTFTNGGTLKHLIGSSVAGCIGSQPTEIGTANPVTNCKTVEFEGIPAVSVTLAILPETKIKTFHVTADDIPDDLKRTPPEVFKRSTGLSGVADDSTEPVFLLFPSPAFVTSFDDLLAGLEVYFPGSQIAGGVASTVSSLSRAKLWQWSEGQNTADCYTAGCVGMAVTGDFQIQTLTARGAKPVGGIYQILKGEDSTLRVIVLDETATDALKDEEQQESEAEEEEEEENVANMDEKARLMQFYAKARIPKPVLAEANFLMRTLSDDDQAFMRRHILIGIDQGGNIGRTASELARLAQGEGHRFTVHQVATAGMKDGSVTFPLGSVNIKPGTRMRFFVRESEFAKKEVEALWTGYKKRLLSEQFKSVQGSSPSFNPGACMIVPTLDRGSKFFLGKQGLESETASRVLPSIACVTGFFANGVVSMMPGCESGKVAIQGSASGYFLLGTKSGRPIYSAAVAAAEREAKAQEEAAESARAAALAAEDAKRRQRAKALTGLKEKAPRSDDGELLLKRREVHSGRALTVSTVEWSVAEKTATPSSTLEGFMWDKETEVDRFRERVPLANLISQCKTAAADPTQPKPRDWVGPVKQAAADGSFVFIPECKRLEPGLGSLRRRYDINKLARDFTLAGVPALSVNCDGVLFGGSLEDITKARQAASNAAVEQASEDGVVVPPVLASDLLLYPYQLYRLRLAGADAVNLVAGALASKDLLYLSKISSSLQLQVLVTVTSEAQIRRLLSLSAGSINGVIVSNRELEDFSFDETGNQALSLLYSDSMKEFKKKHGSDIPVLVEGRVGIIERDDGTGSSSPFGYIQELKKGGAIGAIVGGALAKDGKKSFERMLELRSPNV